MLYSGALVKIKLQFETNESGSQFFLAFYYQIYLNFFLLNVKTKWEKTDIVFHCFKGLFFFIKINSIIRLFMF